VHLFFNSTFLVNMKKYLIITFLLAGFCLAALGQDDGTTTNNWDSLPDLAPTEVSWDYALSPAWYFYFGMGVGVFTGMTGVLARVFQTVTGAGDSGGS
jgi:hypothetical protein